jgi:hypothetical protein
MAYQCGLQTEFFGDVSCKPAKALAHEKAGTEEQMLPSR